MMKWLSLVLGFLFSGNKSHQSLNFTEIGLEIYDQITIRSRKPIALILCGFASIIFICGGVFISLINVTRQYDLTGEIVLGAVFWSGIAMSLIFLAGYIYVFLHAWTGVKESKARIEADRKAQEQAEHQPPGLDQAISLLIMDHIEERKERRARREAREDRPHGPHHRGSHDEHYPGEPTGFA